MSHVTWLTNRYADVAKRCNDRESQMILLILHVYKHYHRKRKISKSFREYVKEKYEKAGKLRRLWWFLSGKLRNICANERFIECEVLDDWMISWEVREEYSIAMDVLSKNNPNYRCCDEVYLSNRNRLVITRTTDKMVCRQYEQSEGW